MFWRNFLCFKSPDLNSCFHDVSIETKNLSRILDLFCLQLTLIFGCVKLVLDFCCWCRNWFHVGISVGQLHVSNISLGKFNEVSDVLEVGEKVKVLVIKCAYPNKPSLSIADLESEPGLFISNKEKVYEEAEEMARRYRQKRQTIFTSNYEPSLTIHAEETKCANWEWVVFQSDNKP